MELRHGPTATWSSRWAGGLGVGDGGGGRGKGLWGVVGAVGGGSHGSGGRPGPRMWPWPSPSAPSFCSAPGDRLTTTALPPPRWPSRRRVTTATATTPWRCCAAVRRRARGSAGLALTCSLCLRPRSPIPLSCRPRPAPDVPSALKAAAQQLGGRDVKTRAAAFGVLCALGSAAPSEVAQQLGAIVPGEAPRVFALPAQKPGLAFRRHRGQTAVACPCRRGRRCSAAHTRGSPYRPAPRHPGCAVGPLHLGVRP
jgi:hypothetical protein